MLTRFTTVWLMIVGGRGQRALEPMHRLRCLSARILPPASFEQVTNPHACRLSFERAFYRAEGRIAFREVPLEALRARDLRPRFGRFARSGRMPLRFSAETRFGHYRMIEIPQSVETLRIIVGGIVHGGSRGAGHCKQENQCGAAKPVHAQNSSARCLSTACVDRRTVRFPPLWTTDHSMGRSAARRARARAIAASTVALRWRASVVAAARAALTARRFRRAT